MNDTLKIIDNPSFFEAVLRSGLGIVMLIAAVLITFLVVAHVPLSKHFNDHRLRFRILGFFWSVSLFGAIISAGVSILGLIVVDYSSNDANRELIWNTYGLSVNGKLAVSSLDEFGGMVEYPGGYLAETGESLDRVVIVRTGDSIKISVSRDADSNLEILTH